MGKEGEGKVNGLSVPSSSPGGRVFLGWGTEVESAGVVVVVEGLGLLAPMHIRVCFSFRLSSVPELCEFAIF